MDEWTYYLVNSKDDFIITEKSNSYTEDFEMLNEIHYEWSIGIIQFDWLTHFIPVNDVFNIILIVKVTKLNNLYSMSVNCIIEL